MERQQSAERLTHVHHCAPTLFRTPGAALLYSAVFVRIGVLHAELLQEVAPCVWWQQSIPFASKEIRAEFRKHDRSMRDSGNLSEPLIVLGKLRRKLWSTLNSLSRALKLQMPSQKMHSIVAFFFLYFFLISIGIKTKYTQHTGARLFAIFQSLIHLKKKRKREDAELVCADI